MLGRCGGGIHPAAAVGWCCPREGNRHLQVRMDPDVSRSIWREPRMQQCSARMAIQVELSVVMDRFGRRW
jgi:hypothetical protein